MAEREERNRAVRREAAERLLAWGFTPPSIAQQLHRSTSWVYEVRREWETAEGRLSIAQLTREMDS